MFNLIDEKWIPVIRQSGRADVIRPAQISETDDPVMELDWPRADFRISCIEFLIGILATAYAPNGNRAWRRGYENPPSTSDLEKAFSTISIAFNLEGPGPRFLQDLEDFAFDPDPIEMILIEAPGASTVKKNTDLLVWRERAAFLSRPAAAMALFTLQSWAPSGGSGHRVGLRGGGPMITLVVPGDQPTLWQMLWANTPLASDDTSWSEEDLPRIFPWMAPTVTSEKDRLVTPESAHPMQCWWGMPRRIRLDFSELDAPRNCDLTDAVDTVGVMSWRQLNKGPKYSGWGKQHPLTPHYRVKGGEFVPVHPQSAGVGYKNWIGVILRSADGGSLPAQTISTWREDREIHVRAEMARILVAGFDMDNKKARSFLECEMPLLASPNEEFRQRHDELAKQLVLSADKVAFMLRVAVRSALFSENATVNLKSDFLASVSERLWEQTEADFFWSLTATEADIQHKWLMRLRSLALDLFDAAAPLSAGNGWAAERIGKARRGLLFFLMGFGKEGIDLFSTLGMPTAETKATSQLKKKSKRKEGALT